MYVKGKNMIRRFSDEIINFTQQEAQNDNQLVQAVDFSYLHYLKVCFWDKFFCFKGRARRKEYLVFQITDFLIAGLFSLLLQYTHVASLNAVYITVSTILIVPLLSVSVRRFHDIGLSGWWCVLGVIPYAAVAFLAIKDSENAFNKYGEIPEGKTFKPSVFARFLPSREFSAPENVIKFEPKNAGKRKRNVA